MGIYSDTFEDNRERSYQLLDASTRNAAFRPTTKEPPRREPLPCPSCPAVFATARARQNHLLAVHAREGFYVRVNDVVITDTAHFGRPVYDLQVVPLGPTRVDLRVETPGNAVVHTKLEPGSPLQVWQDGNRPMPPGVVLIEGRVAGKQRRYEIYVGESPMIDTRDIDERVVTAQAPLVDGCPAAVETILDSVGRLGLLRDRYARGFVEFLLAATFESVHNDWRSATPRMEQAYAALRIFDTPLARLAVASIDFRMNAFRRLLDTTPQSAWGRAAAFFLGRPIPAPREVSGRRMGIWIDDYQLGLLDAALVASERRYDEALQRLSTLPRRLGEDAASAVKLTLLKARASAKLGRNRDSRSAYARLLGDPLFGDEALRYLGGNEPRTPH